jgi:hypothetical protein
MKSIYIFILGCCLVTCHSNSNQRMANRLEQLTQELFFIPGNEYANQVRVAYYDQLLKENPDHPNRNQYRFEKAKNLLYSGRTKEAIALFKALLQEKEQQLVLTGLAPNDEEEIDDYLALSYFRLGEQDNCLGNHQVSSCIFPIDPKALHHKRQGSAQAIGYYEKILENDPTNLKARWLLNLSYMTLGKYPQKVPKKWLLPDSLFRSDYPLKPFQDVAAWAGVATNKLAGGGIVDDFNNDGWLDIMTSGWLPNDQMQFFVNNHDGTFTEKTKEAQLIGLTGGLNMVQADYNNDGWIDVMVLRGAWLGKLGKFPNSLLKNNGDGTFTDVTEEAGMLSFHPTQTATWNDFNNDGWLDVFIGNESSEAENVHPCELYINNQDGTFREVAKQAGIQVSSSQNYYYVKGVTSGDYDKDGLADIYISTVDTKKPNLLFRNKKITKDGIPVFENTTQKAGLGENISSFPTWFWDYDNDGWVDIFVSGYHRNPRRPITHDVVAEYLGMSHTAEVARLYHNNGNGTFTNVAPQLKLNKILYAMGANFGDLDNDGFLDLYLATGEINLASVIPNRMFRNAGGKIFQDVTTAGGFGHLQKGHAVSFADIDNDGDQDVHTVMGGAYEGDNFYNVLFENPYEKENNWITIQLVGEKANRYGIGSIIEISLTENGKKRKIYRQVGSGGSFGCSPLRAEIGLGKATQIDELKIHWKGTKQIQVLKNIKVNQRLKIHETSKTR